MSNGNGNGSNGKEWKGVGQLENFHSLTAQSLRVNGENGSHCNGNLIVYDSALGKPCAYSWEAAYVGPEKWQVTGRPSGTTGDDFSPNRGINHDLGSFVGERLNQMRRTGAIFQHPVKPAETPQLPPPPAPPTTPAPPAPAAAEPIAPTAVLPGAVAVAPPTVIVRIPVKRIRPNLDQPRKRFRKYSLRMLAESIKQESQLEPIEVIQIDGDPDHDYELVIGERRWRAAEEGNISHLDAIVRSREQVPDKDEQHKRCFAADFNREGYDKREITLALMRQSSRGLNAKQLSRICSRSTTWVYQHLALNELLPDLKVLLDSSLPREKQLSFSIGSQIARVPKERQMEVYHQVLTAIGPRLQLIKAKQLVAEIVPDKRAGRPLTPADYARSLRRAMSRVAADALTGQGYPDKVFASLVDNAESQAVTTMLDQIQAAISGLKAVQEKIQAAKSRLKK